MRRKRLRLIALLALLVSLVAGLVWQMVATVRQERLNRALIAAIKKDDVKKTLALLAEGADPNTRDERPPHWSLWQLLLVRVRGQPTARFDGQPALLVAIQNLDHPGQPGSTNLGLIRALLGYGADANGRDKWGDSPLIYATCYCSPEVRRNIINDLLSRGERVNAQNNDGLTALLQAVDVLDVDTVRLLLAHHADPNLGSNRRYLSAIFPSSSDSEGWHIRQRIDRILKQAGAHHDIVVREPE